MQDKRQAARMKVFKGGRIAFNGGHSSIDCVVRNISETGARVMVETTIGIPDIVSLVLNDGSTYQCEVRRRKINELGVHFIPA
jgi:hypothetical protein